MSKIPPKKKIGIVSIPDMTRAGSVIDKLISWLEDNNFEILIEEESAKIFSPIYSAGTIEEISDKADMIILLGGDGTLLKLAHSLNNTNIPILAVNLGSLGFLTEVTTNEMLSTLDYILKQKKDEIHIDERMLLDVLVYDKEKEILQGSALNDLVIDKSTRNKLIRLCTYVDKTWVNTFIGDGIIIATPTGSTAYSLSAGGSIVYPNIHCILLTPICPHILTNRPIIIPDSAQIEISIQSKKESALLTIDGLVKTELTCDNRIVITKSKKVIKLATTPGRSYYQILRTKFKWGSRGNTF